jgi:hypothetical protein
MNKKDLAAFRRQFKADSYCLSFTYLYTAYVKKDNKSMMYAELSSFNMKSDLEREIYLNNFKKLLTGGLNTKMFELAFEDAPGENEGQFLCRGLLDAGEEEFVRYCDAYITRLSENYTYDSDVVLAFAAGKYNKPAGKKSRRGEEEALEGFDDTSYGFKFILCTASKADSVPRGIYFNADASRFDMNSALDKEIRFSAPLEGFLYPAIGDFGADVNKIHYYTAKANVRNDLLLENVLHCRYEPTAREEKEKFDELLRLASGEKIKPEILKNIYDAVNELIEATQDEDEIVTLDAGQLRDIFEESGMGDLDGFDEAFEQVIDGADKNYEFKAASLVSGVARAIRISSSIADIDVRLENLGAVRQVINERGRKCLQIELGENAEINGIALETETV